MNTIKNMVLGFLLIAFSTGNANVNISAAQKLLTLQNVALETFFQKEPIVYENSGERIYNTERLGLYRSLFLTLRALAVGSLNAQITNQSLSSKMLTVIPLLNELINTTDSFPVQKFLLKVKSEIELLSDTVATMQENIFEQEIEALLQESSSDNGSEKERMSDEEMKEYEQEMLETIEEVATEKKKSVGGIWRYLGY